MRKPGFFAAGLCALVLVAANAANAGTASTVEAKETAVAPVEPCNWDGFYIGGNIGGLWTNNDFGSYEVAVDQSPILSPPVTFDIPSHDSDQADAVLGGVQVGLNKQWGHFVVGVEGDFQDTHAHRTRTVIPDTITQVSQGIFASTTDLISDRRLETNWLVSGRARLGLAFGCFLIYGTGGVAAAEVDVWARDQATSTFFVFANPIFSQTNFHRAKDQDTRMGWTAGGGVEWMIFHSLTVGAEFRHSDFGGETADFNSSVLVSPGRIHTDLDSNQATFRVNIILGRLGHFGR
jgi:outer membrane immunogenic protein